MSEKNFKIMFYEKNEKHFFKLKIFQISKFFSLSNKSFIILNTISSSYLISIQYNSILCSIFITIQKTHFYQKRILKRNLKIDKTSQNLINLNGFDLKNYLNNATIN